VQVYFSLENGLMRLHLLLGLFTATLFVSVAPVLPTFAQSPVTAEESFAEGELSMEGDRSLQQGFEQFYSSQLQEAITTFQQAIEQYRQTGDQSGEDNQKPLFGQGNIRKHWRSHNKP
jgi:hypothetical protein